MAGRSNNMNNKISMPVTAIPVLLMVVALTTTLVTKTEAQTPSCAEKLVPCIDFMNSTNPPASCCTPLKEAVEKELVCLCNLYNTPGLLTSFGVNITEALLLPSHCKINGDLSACYNATSPSSSTPPPPGVPGNDNSSIKVAWTGLSAILLLFVSTLIY